MRARNTRDLSRGCFGPHAQSSHAAALLDHMHKDTRREFNDVFRAHMYRHGAWPREKRVSAWCLKCGGYTAATYTAMKKGQRVPEHFFLWFVEMMVALADAADMRRRYRTLLRFLGKPHFTVIDESQFEAIVEQLCGPAFAAGPDPNLAVSSVPDSVAVEVAGAAPVPLHHISQTSSRGAIEEAVGWIFAQARRRIPLPGGEYTTAEAELEAAQIVGCSRGQYNERVRRWAERYPWSVVRAWRGGQPAGVSIVLPLAAGAYERVRRGELSAWQLDERDLDAPSFDLLLEASAEATDGPGGFEARLTHWMAVAQASQITALARAKRVSRPLALRLLTTAATLEERICAIRSGFAPTGTRVGQDGLELFERRIAFASGAPGSLLEAPFLLGLDWLIPEAPPEDPSLTHHASPPLDHPAAILQPV